LAEQLLNDFLPHLTSLTLLPSSGGRFEVKVDERPVFSKKALGRHAEPGEVARLVRTEIEREA
jgi:selenoprotein W-related protein